MSMIIKGIRLRSSSGIGRTIIHLQNGDENDAVSFVHGTPADIRDMHRDAVSIGSKYAVRHWIIAPYEMTTRKQMTEVIRTLAKEFAFDPTRAVVVEHRKGRAMTDATDIHWHVLVGEVDPATGRILATSFDRIKHELIARLSEFSFGHAFVPGKHTDAVVKGLRKRGLHCIADRLNQVSAPSSIVPLEAFTHAHHQESKRYGLDLPALKQTVRRSIDEASSRDDVLKEMAATGLEVKLGDKAGTWIVVEKASGVLLGALHRLAGLRKSAITDMMKVAPPEPREKQNEASPPHILPTVDRQLVTPLPAVTASVIGKRIAEMEQSALSELGQAIPNFAPTPTMQEAKEALRRADGVLSRVVMRRTDLHMEFANIPSGHWWSRFTGSAGRRRKIIAKLETALDEIEAEIRRKEIAITICHRREIRETKAAKERHVEKVNGIVQAHKKARETLAVLGHAKIILEEKPEAAMKGLDFVLSAAKAKLRSHDAIDDQINDLSSNRRRLG